MLRVLEVGHRRLRPLPHVPASLLARRLLPPVALTVLEDHLGGLGVGVRGRVRVRVRVRVRGRVRVRVRVRVELGVGSPRRVGRC